MTLVDQTLTAFKTRLAELDAQLEPLQTEAQQLREAISSLEGIPDSPKQPRATRARKPRSASPKKSRRAPRGKTRETVLAAAQKNPGATSGEIATITGIPRGTVATTMSKLRSTGDLPKSPRRPK